VAAVRDALRLRLGCAVLTVTGTNGKGSTCAFLDAILRASGFRVGLYTSPHLIRYNERVRIDGREARDDELVAAFEVVEHARGSISLTYFEFGTLAAGWLFQRAEVEAAVLEVGLGGRLDAVNLFDADCAVVTSIGIDHREYLGDTREAIAREKAGIFRRGRPAVIADPDPPRALSEVALACGAPLFAIERDFGFVVHEAQWTYWSWLTRRNGLPCPVLRGEHQLYNAAAAIAALDATRDLLPVDAGAIRRGLVEVELPARFQVLAGRPAVVLDVAHNAHAAERLRACLERMPRYARTHAVFGMLKDKDIAAVARVLAGCIDTWHIGPLAGPRGADSARVRAALEEAEIRAPVHEHETIAHAYARARERAGPDDRIVVFGSFYTVGDVLAATRGAIK
jgi:dihydrofolate synthase/folylpolyglutamate synthase